MKENMAGAVSWQKREGTHKTILTQQRMISESPEGHNSLQKLHSAATHQTKDYYLEHIPNSKH